VPDGLKKLQGEWLITSLQMDGNELPESVFSGGKIIVKKSVFTSIAMGSTYEGSVALDESKSPKTFDLLFTAGPEKGNRNLGIYELDGDVWKICIATRGPNRPKTFATKPGDGIALETLTRANGVTKSAPVKSASKKSSSAKKDSAPKSAVDPAVTELEGEWQMLTAVMNGQPLEKKFAAFGKRITKGNETIVYTGPQILMKVTFTLDRSKSPNAIDYQTTQGMHAGKTQLGIYEINCSELKLCFAAPGQPRPNNFSSAPGDNRTFTTWRKK
jgi:uncharacterized protein (TIGR03067 family)